MVVSYNSVEHLRVCVEPLARAENVSVAIVDNASTDGSLDSVADLPVERIPLDYNAGFGHGCNVGARAGTAPYVLFVNPDAALQADALALLTAELDERPTTGLVAPRILDELGETQRSLRRFPRLVSTYSQALFLHRLFPRALWADEMIRRDEHYSTAGPQEWVSGACMLVRRQGFEEVGGFDERFFLYCEDTDLCLRLRQAGYEVVYRPDAVVAHVGGASEDRSRLLHVAVASRIRYARKHRRPVGALLERVGIGLSVLTHLLVARGGLRARRGHARSLLAVFAPSRET